eukprot:CAMPEP_0206191976 /NCGR_PEP_ID=MMETSP0166-20121206/5673_1 /ASSEMBLY_ACC=CAM_ASM_000260 /TAXON_ID=95228 /ORGANISM="Vannella robusta, Strain DIVA3 518/3/11/1/6" /LENGTH=71 /DNA_ID=CAMNT_0053608363 /DNA_START=91 /DNA_END=306 /DNA_ORIENTATION=-
MDKPGVDPARASGYEKAPRTGEQQSHSVKGSVGNNAESQKPSGKLNKNVGEKKFESDTLDSSAAKDNNMKK